MLTEIHFLLTYICNYECDHCFVYSSPRAKGTFTVDKIKRILSESIKIKTLKWVYFEGGEPFLFYPVMLEGIKNANRLGFKTGIVTNAYWANSLEDAELWMKPLKDLGISDLSISSDIYHYEKEEDDPIKLVLAVGKKLGFSINTISIEKPASDSSNSRDISKKKFDSTDQLFFRGRAVDNLREKIVTKPWKYFTECPFEDLDNPKRVHIDPFGYVHICQGIILGNFLDDNLSNIINDYKYDLHPITKLLVKGGPILLAKEYNIPHEETYMDACDFCYQIRRSLLDKFPKHLAPKQVYGFEQ